jgi:O-antigen ligase
VASLLTKARNSDFILTPMALSVPVPGIRAKVIVDLLVASLPIAATLALYLPSGLAMPFRLVTLTLAALAVWTWASTRKLAARHTILGVAVLTLCFLVFGSIGWIRFGVASMEDGIREAFLLLLALSTAVIASRRRTAVWLVYGWLLAGALAGVVGIWEVSTGQHLSKSVAASGAVPIISSFFDNPNLYAYQCGIVLLLLPAAFVALPWGWRWLTVPFGIVVAYLLFATGGRIVLVATMIGAILWALRKKWGRVLVLVGGLALAAASVLGTPLTQRFWGAVTATLSEFQQAGGSASVRTQLVRSALWITQQSDYLGAGPGAFGTWSIRPDDPYRYEQLNNAHWGLMEIVSEYGAVTAVICLLAVVAASVASLAASRGVPRWSVDRSIAFAAFLLAALWPVLSAEHSTWLRQPLSAAHISTLVVFMALLESRRSRRPGTEVDVASRPGPTDQSR